MAKTIKTQPKKRQPTKSRLPSSSARPKTKKLTIYVPFTNTKLEVTVKISVRKKSRPAKLKNLILAKRQTLVTLFVIAAGLAGTLYFSLNILAAPDLKPVTTVQAPQLTLNSPKSLPASVATNLQIPDVGIDSKIIQIGKNLDGTIEVPADYHVAGLYKFGPTPGEVGPSVIVGHVDNFKGPGVFWRLREMQPGQMINIMRADGSIARFKVSKISSFDQNNFPTEEVYGNTDKAELRLITCGGKFNIFTQRYSENTVVFAKLVN